MLKSIKLQFTETGELVLPVEGITLFVGPNNSGKSLVLREVERAFREHPFPRGTLILRDYEVEWPTIETVKQAIERAKISGPRDIPLGRYVIRWINSGGQLETEMFDENTTLQIVNNRSDKNWLVTQWLRWGVIRLDGRSRFNLTNDREGGDLLQAPSNVLAHLFQDDARRRKVRTLIEDAFGLTFVVDPTSLGQLRIRLASEPPPGDEQSLNAEARQFYAKAIHIQNASDGVQAFTGIVTAVLAGDFHTVLIDEPEAFLHPPLARKLGKNLAALSAERGGVLMASTHSADFLMGCIQASASVRVVRLEYSQGKSRGRIIDSQALSLLFKRPLMRSANVVSGLFHDGVVVTESDNDRAFYAEIYHRISEANPRCPSVLFINAQNKQTIRDIVGPLRQFGVPAAAIVDLDFVKDGGSTWGDWLKSSQIPSALHVGYGQQRAAINEAFKATGKNMKTDGGINLLGADEQIAACQLFDNLERFGVFPVRGGELENWLPQLGVAGKKTDWTVAMLERLGGDPSSASYVTPAAGDVWEFIRKILAWIEDPARLGTR
ncbi:ATP-dependent nuclease [Rhodopseudomonas palustris]|uniref:ATP-binding protein n=1 Tax=Rhodopseudomonas palustris TaxID=1076 RepID=A0A418V433_RHOPL|nr:AAA family ATPase [Rhodopseudomonas palustris]RJF70876.1 ATP-binding protein [Rhodopseudomonas palustris]